LDFIPEESFLKEEDYTLRKGILFKGFLILRKFC